MIFFCVFLSMNTIEQVNLALSTEDILDLVGNLF